MGFKEASYAIADQDRNDLIINRAKTVLLWNIKQLQFYVFFKFMQPLQCSMSHDVSEVLLICWFGAQESVLKMVVLLNIFV